jgi:hypothetical protein
MGQKEDNLFNTCFIFFFRRCVQNGGRFGYNLYRNAKEMINDTNKITNKMVELKTLKYAPWCIVFFWWYSYPS